MQEGEFIDADELLRKNTQHLMAAVSSLPELQEQKKVRRRGRKQRVGAKEGQSEGAE